MVTSKVSIIIPAFNCENYIKECLDSVINQTYDNIECLVINDGSYDDTSLIVDQYASKYKFIRHIYKKNGGLSSARNLGICKATGKYIFFLDSDDWIEPDCISKTVTEAEKNKADIVFFSHYNEYLNKTIPYYIQKKTLEVYHYDKAKENCPFIYDMRNITVWGKLYNKECIKDLYFDERMQTAEDVDFNFRVFQNIKIVVYMKNCLLHYRVHEGSAVHGFDKNIERKFRYPIKKLEYMATINNTLSRAYYSFLGIAYILICKNMIFNNHHLDNNEKSKEIYVLNNEDWIQKLFANMDKLVIPLSRKAVIAFGKYKMVKLMLLAYSIKNRMEK